eukprot:8818151-Karenia_brevis.AAC.1
MPHMTFFNNLTKNLPAVTNWHSHFPTTIRESQVADLPELTSMVKVADDWCASGNDPVTLEDCPGC